MRVVYMSAHLDDAILSCGGLIYDQVAEGIPVEIWTFMSGIPNDKPNDVYLKRIEEDKQACHVLGATCIHFSFMDAFNRYDVAGSPLYKKVDEPVLPQESSFIESIASIINANIHNDDIIMCPLGVGNHVDHAIVREACERLIYPILYYVDFPYIDYVPQKLPERVTGLFRYPKTITPEGLRHWIDAVMEYGSQNLYPTQDITRDKIIQYWAEASGIFLWKRQSIEQIFNKIYYDNLWKDSHSASGPGSSLEETIVIRNYLPKLVDRLQIKRVIDVPCGDFFWMRLVKMNAKYYGGDIVVDLIHSNLANYADKDHAFCYMDITNMVVISDGNLFLCRDCLGHLSQADAIKAIRCIAFTRCAYLLTTTFPEQKENLKIQTGAWYPINLQAPPFNFPEPMELVDEKSPLTIYGPKCLGLWKIKSLPPL